MSNEAEGRRAELRTELGKEEVSYLRNARFNYYAFLTLLWLSIVSSGSAVVLGLLPESAIPKWLVGIIGGVPAILTLASKQVGFAHKANWHYRKVDALKALRRRLDYELPIHVTPDNIAAISRSLSRIEREMTAEWENIVAPESENQSTAQREETDGRNGPGPTD